MVKVITVHGTNDGSPNDVGEQWWQLESDFQTKLAERIEEPLEFVPFHWSGANSELERREAGDKLAKMLAKEEQAPIVIGHSHGGSVSLHGLLALFLKKSDQAGNFFRSLITVGTPMIRYQGALNPIMRLNILGQLFGIYAILVGLLVALSFISGGSINVSELIGESLLAGRMDLDGGGFWTFVGQLMTPAVLFAVILPGIVLYLFSRRSIARNRLFANNQLFGLLDDRYTALNHSMDEAITALKTGVDLKLSLVDRKTVRQAIFPVLAFLMAAALIGRTISETVNIEAQQSATVVAAGSADQMAIESRRDVPLALRDATQTLRYLSGDLRGNTESAERFQRIGSLRRQTVYLKNDYLVLDIGAALYQAETKADFISLLATMSPTSKARLVSINPGECLYFAVYMQPSVRDELIDWAQREVSDEMFELGADGLTIREAAALESALRRGTPLENEACPDRTAALLPGAQAVADLLSGERLLAFADRAMISAQGPKDVLIQEETGAQRRAQYRASGLRYPALEMGQAIVFERSAYNDVQATCLLSDLSQPIQRFIPGDGTPSRRVTALTGLCDQVEGGSFTSYDLATTIAGEVEYNLENVIEAGVSIIDQFIRFGGVTGLPNGGNYFGNENVRAGVLSPFYFVASVMIVSWIFSVILAFFLAPVLSGIFNNLIRQNIFGNDGHGEKVREVASGLDFESRVIGTLPANVEQDLVDYVQAFAPKTIQRVREIISMAMVDAGGSLPVTELSEALTWQELIHTSYFDVDSFVDVVADELVEKAGLTRRMS